MDWKRLCKFLHISLPVNLITRLSKVLSFSLFSKIVSGTDLCEDLVMNINFMF